MRTGLARTDSTTARLVSATSTIHEQLMRAREGVVQLQTHSQARQGLQEQTTESIRRLEAVMAGTQSKGAAWENILEALFASLPAEWQVRGFSGGQQVCGVWSAPTQRARSAHRQQVAGDAPHPAFFGRRGSGRAPEGQDPNRSCGVRDRAKEVRKYIDPNWTVNFCIAAVPDAVYELSTRVQSDVVQWNVALVSYSMVVPYLLLVFQTVLRSEQTVDTQKFDACLRSIEDGVAAMQAEPGWPLFPRPDDDR